ncbi:MAG: dihydroorotase [Acidimicrobiia bacterium]|nr:dihydroorotase [Acidimicrobiia bacterium]
MPAAHGTGGSASIELAAPDDWHVHLRDDELLAAVAPITAMTFRYALVMPNLVPPICTTAAAEAYRRRILDCAGPDARPDFTPIMALYLNGDLDPDDFLTGVDTGVVHAAKYYPAGSTTNSERGGDSLGGFIDVLERMAERAIPLLVHAEATNPEIDVYDRERHFLDTELRPVVERLPELRVTVEHLSTRAGVDFVLDNESVRGSITPHHLACDRSDLLANGLRPDLYCKPIINSADDRRALVAAATSGSDRFFLGTDSAPHPASDKYGANARPGIFNAPFAIPVVAEVFNNAGALERLEAFTSVNGCRHYGFERASDRIRLTRTESGSDAPVADSVITANGDRVTIFGVAEARLWTVSALTEAPAG